jgi:ureidoglycolate lyase
MPVKINYPLEPLLIKTQALNADLFSDFGAVIENPAPSLIPSLNLKDFPSNAVHQMPCKQIRALHSNI